MKVSDLIAEIQGKNPNFHSLHSSTIDGMKKAPSIEHQDVMAKMNKDKQDRLLEEHQKEVQKVIDYNKSVLGLDPLYAEIEPSDASKVVIRMFLKDPVQIGAVTYLGADKIPVRTQNGQGELKKIDNPFRFKRLGVVVAASDRNMVLKRGDIVATDYIMAHAPIPGDESIIEYQYAFTHYSYQEMALPKNPADQHFGYILVPSTFVQYKEGNILEDVEQKEVPSVEQSTSVESIKVLDEVQSMEAVESVQETVQELKASRVEQLTEIPILTPKPDYGENKEGQIIQS